MTKQAATTNDTAANIGFEAKLRLAADKLRCNLDAAEHKHVALGRIGQFRDSAKLEKAIRNNLKGLGFVPE